MSRSKPTSTCSCPSATRRTPCPAACGVWALEPSATTTEQGKAMAAIRLRASTQVPGSMGRLRAIGLTTVLLLTVLSTVGPVVPPAAAATLPTGFREEIVFSGLTEPTAVQFSPDGRVFVAEKSGLIKVFDSLTDTS